MGLNAIALGILALVVLYHASTVFFSQPGPPPSPLPVPVQVGKSRSFHSQTRDAGLFTERVRRTAIIGNPTLTPGHKGSTNGSLEWNFLTGVCVCPPRTNVCPIAPNVVWSDGDADDVICDGVDAGGAFDGYEVLDFGGAGANDCDV
jgi:hypothetical protein